MMEPMAHEAKTHPTIAVVTDSTASIPEDARGDVRVVPVHVDFEDPADASGRRITSHPSVTAFESTYATLAQEGYEGVVSVHVSSKLSGTLSAAATAASRADIPVRVIDSATTSMALGFAALEAAQTAAEGGTLDDVEVRAVDVAGTTRVYFTVESLEDLQRGGRLPSGDAILGTVLPVRPVFDIVDGTLHVLRRERTRQDAIAATVDEAVAAAELAFQPTLAVQYDAQDADLARAAAQQLETRLTLERPVALVETSGALEVHLGSRFLGVVLADLDPQAAWTVA